MAIVLVIEEGFLFSGAFANSILELLGNRVACVVKFAPKRNNKLLRNLVNNRAFIGTLSLVKLGLVVGIRRILASMPKTFVPTRFHSLKSLAKKYNKPYICLADLDSDESLKILKSFDADIFVTSVGEKLGQEFLSIPKTTCLNKHLSLLPAYGGILPIFQAIVHGETTVGVTIHEMTSKIDGGKILWQTAVPVKSNESLWQLYTRSYEHVGSGFFEAVQILERRGQPKIVEPKLPASYFSYPSKEDWQQFQERNIKFI